MEMKASIRKSVLKKMKGLEPEIKRVADQSLIQRLRSLPAYQEASSTARSLEAWKEARDSGTIAKAVSQKAARERFLSLINAK